MISSARVRVKSYGQIVSMRDVRTSPGTRGTRASRSKTGRFKFIPRLEDGSYQRLRWKVGKYALSRA